MDILTLLKANILRKKGAFISIAALMIIIAASLTALFSIRDNYSDAFEDALLAADAGDVLVFLSPEKRERLGPDVENSELVERVEYFDTLLSAGRIEIYDNYDGNTRFLCRMQEGIRLYNESLSGFEETIPPLRSGEVYLPLGLKTKLSCTVNDPVRLPCLDGSHEFVIKGFVQEPVMGSANIGYNQIFISDEDYDRILAASRPFEDENHIASVTAMRIYQSSSSTLSPAKFLRQLNLDTKILANAIGSISRSDSIRYTGILFDVIFYVLLVFVGLLFVIVLIVMSHNISIDIEIDYVNLGILKSQGFTRTKIRGVILLQYLLSQIIGIVIGCFAAIPAERSIGAILVLNTGILPYKGLSIGKCLVFMLSLLFASALVIFIKTKKISHVSPVKAISGGRNNIYFDSPLNVPISGKLLWAGLTLRAFTSNRKKYTGTILIVAILTFFMLSVNLIGNLLTSRNALEAMGMTIPDIEVRCRDVDLSADEAKIEALVASYSPILKKYHGNSGYLSVNGENLRYDCYQHPEYINAILKGRAPLYDNEIVISPMVGEMLDIKMGDEVLLTNRDKEAVFIVSGIYQTGNDSGKNFALSFDGAKKLGIKNIPYMGFVIEDTSRLEEIVDALNQSFSDILSASLFDAEKELTNNGTIETAVQAIQAIIYLFSVLFAFIIVRMVCAKTFVQERTDMGIFKAIGFMSNRLRLLFAFRFLLLALLGAALGTALSVAFSARLIGSILSIIGLGKFSAPFTFIAVILPIGVIGVCFFVFAYFSSRKIRHVATRELIVE